MSVGLTLDIVSTVSGFGPVIAALYNYKHLDKVLKIAAFFFLLASTFDPVMWLSSQLGAINNMPLLHLNILVSLFFYGLLYYHLFLKRALKRASAVFAFIVFIIMLCYNSNIFEYPSVSNTALSIMLIVLSLAYFYQLLNPLKYVDIEKQSFFWINAGVLIYSSVNIFLFMIFTQIPVADRPNYYIINSITNIIANLLFSVGLLCKPQKAT
ncbi:MAG: hypothetical protein AAGC65_04745 [Mucilaginibacter sp.]|uniref:hypothetical protein n=1 Tax=Mucilaginibacter sp. TaxID=1882438 RepID=UPI0031AAA7AC